MTSQQNSSSTVPVDGGQYSSADLEQNRGGQVVGTAVAFLVLTTITVILRSVSRQINKSPWIWADIYVPAAWLLNIGLDIACLIAVRYGAGKHLQAVPEEDIIPFFKTVYYAVPAIYTVVVNLPKLAILDLYLHVFVDKFSRSVTRVMQVIIVANILINTPIIIAQCRPVAALWDHSIVGGWCHDIRAHYLWISLPNILIDLVVLLLPLPLIYKLQTSGATKVGLLITFLLGSLGLVTSILRFVTFVKPVVGTGDQPWQCVDALIWTVVECRVYLMCACLVAYRPLLHWIQTRKTSASVSYRMDMDTGRTMNPRMRSYQQRRLSSRDAGVTFEIVTPKAIPRSYIRTDEV